MLGWTEDELRGQRFHELVHVQRADGSPVPLQECAVQRVLTTGRTARVSDDAFGLRTIAEGIEDEETLRLLRTEGVDFGQGYYLGRPAPVVPEE